MGPPRRDDGAVADCLRLPHLKLTHYPRGWCEVRVERETVRWVAGDALSVEPGEAHAFLANSPDSFHFVVHTPGRPQDEARADRGPVPRERLGSWHLVRGA